MAKVLFVADHVQEVELAARLQFGAACCGDQIIVVAQRLSAVLNGRMRGVETYVTKISGPHPGIPDRFRENNYEVRTGYMNMRDARCLYDSIVTAGAHLIQENPDDWAFILGWNGALVSSQAVEALGEHFGIPILFMEIANLPGRMVFDPDGSNCDASVAKDPSILDDYPIDDAAYEAWRKNYIDRRTKTVILPQAKRFRQPNYWFGLDIFGFLFGAAPAFSVGIINRVQNIIMRFLYEPYLKRIASSSLPLKPFVFLPLQVSTDTNLIVRSSIDNFEAIARAKAVAREFHAALVIKLHPAEREGTFYRDLSRFMKNSSADVILTSVNTIECIMKSICVITINSTVGFEARILGKRIMLLERTLYSEWTDRQMAQFALRYTVPFDMYSRAPATADQWQEIKRRARAKPKRVSGA